MLDWHERHVQDKTTLVQFLKWVQKKKGITRELFTNWHSMQRKLKGKC